MLALNVAGKLTDELQQAEGGQPMSTPTTRAAILAKYQRDAAALDIRSSRAVDAIQDKYNRARDALWAERERQLAQIKQAKGGTGDDSK